MKGFKVNMEEVLHNREFEKAEKEIGTNLGKYEDKDMLMKMALLKLQFPFEDEDSAIIYLNRMIELDKYNFAAIVIKLYLQNHYYGKMDDDLERLTEHIWETDYERAIVTFIMSWKADAQVEKDYLLKSISQYSHFVNPYLKLAQLYAMEGNKAEEKRNYMKALENVRSTEFIPDEVVDPQAFIDGYITGVTMSKEDYHNLKKMCQRA